eukprot:9471902-Pyramimonas_sp.AAC.1
MQIILGTMLNHRTVLTIYGATVSFGNVLAISVAMWIIYGAVPSFGTMPIISGTMVSIDVTGALILKAWRCMKFE